MRRKCRVGLIPWLLRNKKIFFRFPSAHAYEYFLEFYDNAHNWEMSGTIASQVHVCGASLRLSQIHEQSSGKHVSTTSQGHRMGRNMRNYTDWDDANRFKMILKGVGWFGLIWDFRCNAPKFGPPSRRTLSRASGQTFFFLYFPLTFSKGQGRKLLASASEVYCRTVVGWSV